MTNKLLRPPPPSHQEDEAVRLAAIDRDELITRVIDDVCEIPDRTSPDDQPDMLLVTGDELKNIMEKHFPPTYNGDLPDIELVSAAVHAEWMQSKRIQGVTSRKSEGGEELMVPYDALSEKAKDLDRGSVQAVYDALLTLASSRRGGQSAQPSDGWIPVSERLPEEREGKTYVLLAWVPGGIEEYQRVNDTDSQISEIVDMANTAFVHANASRGWFTHWRPLPAPPTKE